MKTNLNKKMMKWFCVIILSLFYLSNGYSQQLDDTIHVTELEDFYVNRFRQNQYQSELKRLQRVYPLAVKAKAILDEYETNLSAMEKKKDARKYSRKMNDFLKDEFSYAIRDLYVSEGRLLIQLIHRETGMTVKQIMDKYLNGMQTMIYNTTAKMMKHNLNDKWEPSKKHAFTETVIQDILEGITPFEMKMDAMTREKFKESQQEYRQKIKESRSKIKDIKKENKEKEKEIKKEVKQNKKKSK